MKRIAQFASLVLAFGLIAIFSQRAEAKVKIKVKGSPRTITVTAPAIAGDLPADQQNNSTTMDWSSDETATMKITAQLSGTYPTGINLYVEVSAPGGNGGSSTGQQLISVGSEDVVTGIGVCNVKKQKITYTVKITEMAAPDTYQQTVTYTIEGS